MRIAILGSVALSIPPKAQGGTEWIAYYEALGLANKGHKVLLFGAIGTKENFKDKNIKVIEAGKGNLVLGSLNEAKFDLSKTESSRKLRLEIVHLATTVQKLIELKDQYDLIINNMRGEAVFLPIAKALRKPFVNVMHLPIFKELAGLFKEFNTSIITISNAQRKEFPDLNYLATVYNGVDTSKFAFNSSPKDYLLMMASIGRHKNQKAAIEVAKALGKRLILAGKIREKDYFNELKKDIDGEKIRWFGELGFEDKLKLYQEAEAFLFPIEWEEPFGLVMIEAMSCGTPVVAFNKGAIPEVVVDGLTGFVVENTSQMIEAVKRISSIDRKACREHVEKNFTVEKMVDDYEKVLQRV